MCRGLCGRGFGTARVVVVAVASAVLASGLGACRSRQTSLRKLAVDAGAASDADVGARPASAPPRADAGLAGAGGLDAGAPGGRMCNGFHVVDATVHGSIAESLGRALAGDGDEVAAHFGRIFMWDLNLRRDVEPGDGLHILWRRTAVGDVEIGAARYQSRRLARRLSAYRYKAAGDQYASYWDETGAEVPRRLKGGPLENYEQITALLKDRPTHQGMDFKTPAGTEVHAPHAGLVLRTDWKLGSNGHCIELRYDDGVIAKFLHLSEVKVQPGARIRPGQILALSGNTGHSTAPHLHYQLGRGARTLDPVDYHGVLQRRLEKAELPALAQAIVALEGGCGGEAAPTTGAAPGATKVAPP